MGRGNEDVFVQKQEERRRQGFLRRKVIPAEDTRVEPRRDIKRHTSEEKKTDPGILLDRNRNVIFQNEGSSEKELLYLLHEKNPSIGLYPGLEMPNADLSLGNWGGFLFSSSNFLRAKFDASRMPRAQFSPGSILNEASFRSVDATGVMINSSSLKDADLTDANFTGAKIHASSLRGAKLAGANFTGASFFSSDLSGLDFSGVALDQANFSRAILNDAKMRNVTCFAKKRLQFTKFIRADLRGTSFQGSALQHSDFSGAKLAGASFAGAYLQDVNFSHADLSGVDFRGSHDLRGANLTGTGYDSFWGREKLMKGKNL
jgi:uncharacterized protein YjbI with pentapeptide repeats